ncbi:MAG: hypothetical protein KGN79_01150 [Acidobacteriota bacterium]|nr:hypothetical protein [Acidobacteriota bacterium]
MLRVTVGCFAVFCASLAGSCQSPRAAQTTEMRPITMELRPMPIETARRAAQLHAMLKKQAAEWVNQQAAIEAQKRDVDLDGLRAAIRVRFEKSLRSEAKRNHGVNMESDRDIDALVFIVMSQAAQEEEADLESMMQQIQAINKQKEGLRQMIGEVRQAALSAKPRDHDKHCETSLCKSLAARLVTVSHMSLPGQVLIRTRIPQKMTYAELEGIEGQLEQDQDSLNDMTEVDQMKLQQAMDRRSKVIETISNIMKKISDTDSSIVSNMK